MRMLNVRLEDEHYAKVVQDAQADGLSLANHVRQKLGLPQSSYSARKTVLVETPVVLPAEMVASPPRAVPSNRKEMCVHRNPPGTYCARCD